MAQILRRVIGVTPKGEITDKGSINQRAVLQHRDDLVEALHGDTLADAIKPTL